MVEPVEVAVVVEPVEVAVVVESIEDVMATDTAGTVVVAMVIVQKTMDAHELIENPDLEDILASENWAETYAKTLVSW